MEKIILITGPQLRNELRTALIEHEKEKANHVPVKVYTINKVAKMLGKAHATIKRYVDDGIIKTTKSGLITEDSINEFLK